MPLDKQQKTTQAAKKPHDAQAGPQHPQGGWSSRASRRWGSSWGDGELSPAWLPSLCPLPRLALTGHGAFGLCGEVDGGFSLGPPARSIPGFHRVTIGLRLPQVLDQHHALLGVFNQHLLHGPDGYCKARALLSPSRHRGPHKTLHFGVRIQPDPGEKCSSSLGCSQQAAASQGNSQS